MGDGRQTIDATAGAVRAATKPVPAPTLELVCGECGYGVIVRRTPPECPMCRGQAWESAFWRPFSRPPAQPPAA